MPSSPPSAIPHYYLYGETVNSQALDYLHMALLQESLPKHNWEIVPHRHDDLHQLLIIESGSVLAQVNEASAEHGAYCVLSIPAREVHGFMHQPAVQGYIMTISESFLRGSFADAERQAFPFVFNEALLIHLADDHPERQAFSNTLSQLWQEYQQSKSGQSIIMSAYLKILFVLLMRAAQQQTRPSSLHDGKITLYERFLAAVEQHYREQWTVSAYAQSLGLTESRLNRLCQRYAGQNALPIIHTRHIIEAKRSLIYANMSVNEVAYELGFKDPAYFSRFFNKHCGETPGQFKKRLCAQG